VLARGAFDGELPAGDFVRWARQVVDLLAQLADTDGVPGQVRDSARRAVGLIGRGVVADSGVTGPARLARPAG
jgi:ATP-dependent RNA helicase HelY